MKDNNLKLVFSSLLLLSESIGRILIHNFSSVFLLSESIVKIIIYNFSGALLFPNLS